MNFDKKSRSNLIIASVIFVIGVAIDKYTKYLAAKFLVLGKPVVIMQGFLNLGLVRNQGAVFGMGSQMNQFWRNFILVGLSSAAIIFIIYLLYNSLKESRILIVGISMILAGAVGNVYDRIIQRYVVDFIEIHYKSFTWPNFNFADILICVGVGLYILSSILTSRKKSQQ